MLGCLCLACAAGAYSMGSYAHSLRPVNCNTTRTTPTRWCWCWALGSAHVVASGIVASTHSAAALRISTHINIGVCSFQEQSYAESPHTQFTDVLSAGFTAGCSKWRYVVGERECPPLKEPISEVHDTAKRKMSPCQA